MLLRFSFFRLVVTGALLAALGVSAWAEDPEPFALDKGGWISFDHYQEKAAHPPKNKPLPAVEPETVPDAPVEKPTAPLLAPPLRPVLLPVLPGVNKGFDLQVNSTIDDQKASAQVDSMDTTPTLRLQEHNWQSAVEVAKQHAAESADEHSDNVPLDVRMTFLPDSRIRPEPTPQRDSTRVQDALNHIAKPEQPKTAQDKAQCAALDAAKKKELEAIQSDRATLTALQEAIAKLGLQKQLNFSAGVGGMVPEQTPLPSGQK